MPQNYMAQFVRQNQRQRSFVWKNIEQTTADDNGVSDRERLQGRGQQNAAMEVALQVDVVGDQQIVHHRGHDLIHFAWGCQQPDFLQAFDGILFCLLLPHALCDHGRGIGSGIALVFYRLGRVDQNLGELLIFAQPLQIVTPQSSLSLEVESLGQAGLEVGFLRIDVGRKPCSWPHIQTPAVKMEEEIDFRLGEVSSVKTNNIVVLILHPDPAQKTNRLFSFAGLDVDDQATDFSEKFTANKSEFVILLLKIAVEHDHLGKAHGEEVQRVYPGQLAKHAMAKSGLSCEGNIFRAVGHIEPAQKVLISDWYRVFIGIVLQILQIGFDQRMHVPNLRHEVVLALYDPIHN